MLDSVQRMVADVTACVPGYGLKNHPVIEEGPFDTPGALELAARSGQEGSS